MKKKMIVALTIALALAGVAQSAEVYVAHGINGADLGADTALPVDIVVNGSCFLTGFNFGDFAGPVELPGGSYDLEVKLSDGACGGATAISGTVPVGDNERVTLIAHLAEGGDPTLSKYRNPLRRVRDGFGRIEIRHTADAPSVDIELVRKRGQVSFTGLSNGNSDVTDLSRANWKTSIFAATAKSAVVGPVKVRPRPGRVTIIYAVGSLENGTFGFLVQELVAHTDAN